MKLSGKKLSRAIVLFSSLMCISIPAVQGEATPNNITTDMTLTKDTTLPEQSRITLENDGSGDKTLSIKGGHTLTFQGRLKPENQGYNTKLLSYLTVGNKAYEGKKQDTLNTTMDIDGNVVIQGNDDETTESATGINDFESGIYVYSNPADYNGKTEVNNKFHISGTTTVRNLGNGDAGIAILGTDNTSLGKRNNRPTAFFDGKVSLEHLHTNYGFSANDSNINLKDGLFLNHVNTDLVPVWFETSDVKTKNINVDGVVANRRAGVLIGSGSNVTADDAVTLSNITFKSGAGIGLDVISSALAAPTISLNHLTADKDNINQTFIGMAAEILTNQSDPSTIKADSLYIGNITNDVNKSVIGLVLQGAPWTSFHKDSTNGATIENITNNTKDGVTYGMEVGYQTIDPESHQVKDLPYSITGDTVIRNINSTQGSAAGLIEDASCGTSDANIHLHNLKISDIHGSDLSLGIFSGIGDTIADNADINMTGKDVYDGLYGAATADSKKASVNSFAIYGPFVGNVKMVNPNGVYTIHGNILADQQNHDQMIQMQLKNLDNPEFREDYKNRMGYTDEQVDAYITELKKNLSAVGHINLGGHLTFYGDAYAKNGGILNMDLTKGSVFEGQADNYVDFDTAGQLTPRKVDINNDINTSAMGKAYGWDNEELQMEEYLSYGIPALTAGQIHMTMEDGSLWKTHGKSFIDTLNFKNGGLVDMRAENGASINVGKLTGNGNFLMSFSNNPDHSDMIYAKDISEAGVQNIQANLKDGLQPKDLKGMRFATTGGDDYKRDPAAKFKISLYKNQGVNDVTLSVKNEKFDPAATAINEHFNGGKNGVGTYKPGNDYVTAVFSGRTFTRQVPDQEKIQQAGGDVTDDKGNLLPEYMKTLTVDNSVKEGTNWYIDAAVNTPSNSGKVIKKAAALDYANAVYGVYTDTLNKRLGEARYSADGDGLWARVRHDRMGKENRYDAKDTMTELGYDWTRRETSFGKHLQGAALDYMTGDADYKGVDAHSDTKRYGLWLYDTRLGKKGHYTDLVAKIGRFSNKFNLQQEDADSVHGDYHDNYGSLSFEYGRKKPLSSSWYIEPQAQMQYTYLGSADYRTSQGSQVHLAGTDSLIGRIGFRLGRDIGDKTTFYLDANAYHEFLGNQDIFANDITGTLTDTVHNDGSWYEAGVGVSTKLNQNTYGFLSFDKGFGPGVEHTWSFEGGLNYKF